MSIAQQQAWLAQINGGDFVANSGAAIAAAASDAAVPTDIEVVVYDKYWRPQGELNNYISLKATIARLKLDQAQIAVDANDPLGPALLQCWQTLVPVTITFSNGALRRAFWVETADDKELEDGTRVIECQLAGIMTYLDRVLVWPHPFLPIEVQPSEAMYIGPTVTCLKTMVAENSLRLQLGLWELFNYLGSLDPDWRTWFGTLLIDSQQGLSGLMNAVTTPVCVIPWDPLTDTSIWTAFHGRMDTCWKLITQQIKDNGLYPSLDLWMPGDPQPGGPLGLLFPLRVPTYVFNIKDYSGVTGPTGTAFDGLLQVGLDAEAGLLGGVLAPFLNPGNEYVPPGSNIAIAPVLGVNFTPPWVIFNADVDDSGITSLDIAYHAPLAWSVVLGGRSPQWLNDLLNATLEYLIDMLMLFIGISGIPNTMLDGILSNAFLAFEVFENFNVRKSQGPYGPPEKFFPSQSTYNVDTLMDAIKALWDVRGYPAAQFGFVNGQGYQVGRDVFPGALASVIKRGTVFTDYVDVITVTDDVNNRGRVEVQVGDGKREESPMAIFQRKLVGLEEDINMMLLAPPS